MMVYYELDRCPECGFDFYPADDEPEEDLEPPRARSWGVSMAAIIVGWLVSGTAMFVVFYLFSSTFYGATDWQIWSLILVAGTTFTGGYIASAMARRLPVVHGFSVAVLSMANAALLETLWRSNVMETLIRPMTFLVWGLIIGGGIAGAVTSMQVRQKTTKNRLQGNRESNLYDDLLLKVRHDQGVANRLIALERERAPMATRNELIRNAIARWERDNR
jgi:hypothetical protein